MATKDPVTFFDKDLDLNEVVEADSFVNLQLEDSKYRDLQTSNGFYKFAQAVIKPAVIISTTKIPDYQRFQEDTYIEEGKKVKDNKESRDICLKIATKLKMHQILTRKIILLLKCTKIVTWDAASYGNQSQISFCYSGFKQQSFLVGNWACIDAWRLIYSSSFRHFNTESWDGASKAKSIGKELMQTSPDLTELYQSGNGSHAKKIMAIDQLHLLQNLCLASFTNSAYKIPKSIPRNEPVRWSHVLDKLTDKETNKEILEAFMYPVNIKYIVNPSFETIKRILHKMKTGWYEKVLCTADFFCMILRYTLYCRFAMLREIEEEITAFQNAAPSDENNENSENSNPNQHQFLGRLLGGKAKKKTSNVSRIDLERAETISDLQDAVVDESATLIDLLRRVPSFAYCTSALTKRI